MVRMQHLCSSRPSSIFYGLFYSELLRIAICKLFFSGFIPNLSSELYNRMVLQGGNTKHHCKKMVQYLTALL